VLRRMRGKVRPSLDQRISLLSGKQHLINPRKPLHGRAPLLQRMTSLHQRLPGPSEVAWQSLATDSVVRGSSGPTSVIAGLLSLTVAGFASTPLFPTPAYEFVHGA